MLLMKILKDNHKYAFYGSAISICPGADELISIENAEAYEDGSLMTDFYKCFIGHVLDANETAAQAIRAFINTDASVVYEDVIPYITNFALSFHENTNIMVCFDASDGRKAKRLIQKKYLGERGVLELQLVDADGRAYYSNSDEFIVIRADGSLATDYEFLYDNSLLEALEKGDCKYKSEEIRAYF